MKKLNQIFMSGLKEINRKVNIKTKITMLFLIKVSNQK